MTAGLVAETRDEHGRVCLPAMTSADRRWDGGLVRGVRSLAHLTLLAACVGCARQAHSLGYDEGRRTEADADTTAQTSEETPDTVSEPVVTTPSTETSASTEASMEAGADLDSGANDSDTGATNPLPVLRDPPNQFVDVLSIEPSLVDARIEAVFEQLFYGDPAEEAVYVEVAPGSAYIYDVLHDDTRLDAMGYGMMIAVQLDRREEFDSLWTYVQERFEYKDGPRKDYYRFNCQLDVDTCDDVIDTYGVFYVATALFIADRRWQDDATTTNYGDAARRIIAALRSKESQNGGVVDGVLNVFAPTYLPRIVPLEGEAEIVATGALLPPFFELWGLATQDNYWQTVAERSRSYLLTVPHQQTGLTPARVDENLVPIEGFLDDSYGTGFMLAIDHSWVRERPEYLIQVNRMLAFFVERGLPTYPAEYELDGTVLIENSSMALVALNGAAAGIASIAERDDFIRAVWEAPIPVGLYRFYDGMNQLLSMLYLSGELRGYY